MKTLFNLFCLTSILTLAFTSCIKKEVVPKPETLLDLQVHFYGSINGTLVEYSDDVDGFNGETSDAKQILTSPLLSSMTYLCDMNSNLINRSIKVGIGSIYWDAGAVERPTLTQFQTFFTGLKNVSGLPYTSGAKDGFEVVYTDNFGNVWTSSETSVNPQTVLFTSIENKEDNTGDYSLFTVDFTCYLYRTVTTTPLVRDSILIENGVLDGWFKR